MWNENIAVLNQTAQLAGTIQLEVQYDLFDFKLSFLPLMYHVTLLALTVFFATMHIRHDPCHLSHIEKCTNQQGCPY